MKQLNSIFLFCLVGFSCFCQPKAGSIVFDGSARFQHIFEDDFGSKIQGAVFPKASYFVNDFISVGFQLFFRFDQEITELENEIFPTFSSQELQDIGAGLSTRFYFSLLEDRKLGGFFELEYLFDVDHGSFNPSFRSKFFKDEIRFGFGANFLLTENIAIETSIRYNFKSFNNLFLSSGMIVFGSFANKNHQFDAREFFPKKGTWSMNPKGLLSFQNLFKGGLPSIFQPEFSIFLSDKLLFENILSFIFYRESSIIDRSFFRYEPRLQWYLPILKNSFITPRFRIQYSNTRRDRDSRITKNDHFSTGFMLGVNHVFRKLIVLMGLEVSYWKNFTFEEKIALIGLTEFNFFIAPNVKLDVKTQINFLHPVKRYEELIYGILEKKAVSFDLGFSFYFDVL